MTSIVIIGAEGMLGRSLSSHFQHFSPILAGKERADLTRPSTLESLIPERAIVVNAAAYTNVDGAETDEGTAFAINAQGVRNLAEIVRHRSGQLIHLSTDYVFDGTASSPYSESSQCSPASAYGRSKWEGEKAILDVLPDSSIILRTAWLYGHPGKNFPATILRLAGERETIDVVTDQVGQPTWTHDVARMIGQLISSNVRSGTFHATNSGQASWFEFAKELFLLARLDPERVRPVTSAEFSRPAPRPSYSVLGHEAWLSAGLPLPRHWKEALTEAWSAELFQTLEKS